MACSLRNIASSGTSRLSCVVTTTLSLLALTIPEGPGSDRIVRDVSLAHSSQC